MTPDEFIAEARRRGMVTSEKGINLQALEGAKEVRTVAEAITPPQKSRFVILNLPPSTNNLFATVRGMRVKAKAYKAWVVAETPTILKLHRVAAPYAISLRVRGKVNKNRDLDNMIKPIADALVSSGVIEGDTIQQVQRWDVRVETDAGLPRVEVEITRILKGE